MIYQVADEKDFDFDSFEVEAVTAAKAVLIRAEKDEAWEVHDGQTGYYYVREKDKPETVQEVRVTMQVEISFSVKLVK